MSSNVTLDEIIKQITPIIKTLLTDVLKPTQSKKQHFDKYKHPDIVGFFTGDFELNKDGLPILTGDDVKWESTCGTTIYVGSMKNGKLHGIGKTTYSNGDVYEGEWKENIKSGQCKYTYSNGDVYEGEWKDNNKHGQGKITYHNGDVYEGEYKYSARYGQGKMIYHNGDVYEGEWERNTKHGKGRYTWKDGSVYDGTWINDHIPNY